MEDNTYLDILGNWGGSNFGSPTCPKGEVIVEISGRSGSEVDKICAKCSDGTNLGCYGGNGGSPYIYNGPFNEISLRVGERIDKIFNSGGNGGGPYTGKCGPDRYLVGFSGSADSRVKGLRFICGVDKNKYCLDNLESPVCKNVNSTILNTACSKKMTKTCYDRKSELDESLMMNYCRNNLDDDICACYRPPPSYIENEVRGLPYCWNDKCATVGYLPKNLRNQTCPNITICRQEMPLTGDSNILTSNVIVQDCRQTSTNTFNNITTPTTSSPTTSSPTTSSTSSPTSSPTTTISTPGYSTPNTSTKPNTIPVTDPNNNPIKLPGPNESYNTSSLITPPEEGTNWKIIIFILFIVVAVIFGVFSYNNDSNNSNDSNINSNSGNNNNIYVKPQ